MNFGDKLKKIRRENNLSQEKMAELLFTTQGNYSQYESSNRIPSIELLQRVIENFKVDANWLLSHHNEQIVNFNDNSTCNIVSLKTDHFHNSTAIQLNSLEEKLAQIILLLQAK